MHNPFRYFNSSPEVIGLTVMMYIRYPLSLRQVEDLLFERGINICHDTVRFWWNRFGPMVAAEIRKRRVHHRSYSLWRWHLDEVFVRMCVQLRLACSAGISPAGVRVRGPVVWIAGWRETKTLKPIDKVSLGEITSHWAVTTVNANVASKVKRSEGRARIRRVKAACRAEI